MKIQKPHLLIALLVFVTKFTLAQNALAPDYLTKQSFPDSVMNISFITLTNEKVTFAEVLEKHSGRKLFIDFWASWCRDCIVGYPKLEALMKEVDSTKVDFVFISVDKDDVRWRNAIERFKIKGTHYRSETAWYSPLTNYIALDWIPRYVIVDEKQHVVLPKAVTTDHPDVKKALATED
jgi:thiol-disulfide isomerase/thioredoxin